MPKFIWKIKEPKIVKTILKKKNKIEGFTLRISKLTTKQQFSRQCDTGIRTDKQINGTELKVQKETHVCMVN